MPANDYHFVTHWRVEGTPQQVANNLEVIKAYLGDSSLLAEAEKPL